ncbi:MAG TPA: PAS domain-containing sensor histidine kinase [Cyclobacteriaceae bacterium]|nr:PAS domain-containing sensor histidine kinase [Cyclobacteriaceae bacterium]
MIKTEQLVRKVIENPKNIVLVTDEQYNIRYASSAVETIFGIKPVSILGRSGFDFVPESKRQEWRDCLIEANGNKSGEITLFTNNGDEVHFDVTVTNHIDHDDIHGIVVFMYNITERRLIQKKLESENHHLDHFIFKTTHDLKAPLRSALGLIQLAEMEPQEYVKYLGLIKSSLVRLDGLIEEMNKLYQNDKMAIQNDRIDVRILIEKEIENLHNLPEAADIRIDVFVDGDVPFYSDPLRVKTIVSNLLSNAIKYSDPQKVRKYIQLSAHIFIDTIFLTIEDNGIGIDGEHQQKIFDLFYRVTADKKGTGLGLYIVKDTIDRLNGKVYVKSVKGESTSFTITLPNNFDKLSRK